MSVNENLKDGFIMVDGSKKDLAQGNTDTLTVNQKVSAACMSDVYSALEKRRPEFSASTWWSIVQAQRKDSITFFYKLLDISNKEQYDYYNTNKLAFRGGNFEVKAVEDALKEAKASMTEKQVTGEVTAVSHSSTGNVETYAWIHVIKFILTGDEITVIADYPHGKAADKEGFQDRVTGHGDLSIAGVAGRMQLNKV